MGVDSRANTLMNQREFTTISMASMPRFVSATDSNTTQDSG